LTRPALVLVLLLLLVALASEDAEHAAAALLLGSLAALHSGHGGDGLGLTFAGTLRGNPREADGVGLQGHGSVALKAGVSPTWWDINRGVSGW